MIKIENVEICGLEPAIRGMRNPMNSWELSDSTLCIGADGFEDCHISPLGGCPRHENFQENVFCIGANDLTLMKKLCAAGSDHRKYMRMITVYADIVSHQAWWSEFDTYKVGTVKNSCSKMHTIHIKPFVMKDFSTEGIEEVGGTTAKVFVRVLDELEKLRQMFNKTQEKKYWRAIIELLPTGFNLRATVMLNYEILRNIYHSRKAHKLDEWVDFCAWIEVLPYSELMTGTKGEKA